MHFFVVIRNSSFSRMVKRSVMSVILSFFGPFREISFLQNRAQLKLMGVVVVLLLGGPSPNPSSFFFL